MSHFCGLVILTPDYMRNHDMDESLEKYDESREVPEYKVNDVSVYDKIRCLLYYNQANLSVFCNSFITRMESKEGFISFDEFRKNNPELNEYEYRVKIMEENPTELLAYFNEVYPEMYETFNEVYEKNGEDWNGFAWRLDENGVLSEYSKYNKDSKWDWYVIGGRWDKSILTKSGEYTNECLLGELDLTPFKEEDYEDITTKKFKNGVEYHYTSESMPYCVVINGAWYEKGQMGWWGISRNDKEKDAWNNEFLERISKLPTDSKAYNVDFHI